MSFGQHDGEIILREGITVPSGAFVPGDGLRKVLWHPFSSAIHDPELELGLSVIVVSGLFNPICRRPRILEPAVPIQVSQAKDVLGFGIATFSGLGIPSDRLAFSVLAA